MLKYGNIVPISKLKSNKTKKAFKQTNASNKSNWQWMKWCDGKTVGNENSECT